ncbi:MAG: type I restriction enzyme [Fimbriimonadales bacterium]|nr:MAG: type I restriction enzyme [Fimbriimonadales bacterium]
MTSPAATARINELNEVETPARELVEKLGYVFVPRAALATERADERDVLLEGRLASALRRLNPWMTDDHVARAIFALRNVAPTGMARNQAIHEYLTYGMPLDVDEPGGRRTRTVHFFDFDFPEPGVGRNEYVVTTQMRVRRAGERDGGAEDDERHIIPDLVLFVNGIPLVVIEAKSGTLIGDVWKARAVRQLLRYQGPKGAPELFDYNLMCVAISGSAAAYAAVGAPEKAYAPWKLEPAAAAEARARYGVEPRGQAELILGLLTPATLLDILRDFVVFEPEQGKLIKKLPRYQQYRAVHNAMTRILRGTKPEERGGVVWHTQGSGKSLTMLWLATKLRREPRLDNPTIVIVTDRIQLDRQISETFRRCGFPSPERATRSRPRDATVPPPSAERARRYDGGQPQGNEPPPPDLQTLLRFGQGRTIMTTIQKFEEAVETPAGGLEVLNPASNLVVIVDEAHRTQYGLIAAKMRRALPKATFIGFTGTPIDKGFKRSTMGTFGPLIDRYDIKQSVEDKATVPIFYEARLPDLAIVGPESVDRLFERVFAKESPEVRDRIKRRYATKELLAEADQRIQQIAEDIAKHYEDRFQANGFKAQVVATSRLAAARYKKWLVEFGVNAWLVVTTTPDDDEEITEALRDQPTAAEIESGFKDPNNRDYEVLVVVDQLITGFDAPVEQVLYLDRNLREHTLLQAIARVNRPCTISRPDGTESVKDYGLVVDYWGISKELEDALSAFDALDAAQAMGPLPEDPADIIESYAKQAEKYFPGLDLNDVWACVKVFEPDRVTEGTYKRDLWDQFVADYRLFAQKVDAFLPDPRALSYVDRLARLATIKQYVKAHLVRGEEEIDWADVSAKVKMLLEGRIAAEVRPLMDRPVSILDQDFSERIANLPHDEARASAMEHAIRAQIKERFDENPTFYERLSEALQKVIDDMRQQVIDAAEACRRLAKLRDETRALGDLAAREGLSETSLAVYELIDRALNKETVDSGRLHEEPSLYLAGITPELKSVALRIEEVMRRGQAIVDWQRNEDVLRIMRRDIKRELRGAGNLSETQLNDLVPSIVEIARRKVSR